MIELRETSPLDAAPAVSDLTRVLIVQSQHLVGDALEALLNSQPDMIVVGKIDCEPGAGALALAAKPGIVIIDFRSNSAGASVAATEILTLDSKTAIVALTRDHADHALIRAVEAGSSAVISESDTSASVLTSIRQVAHGVNLIPPDILATLLRRHRMRGHPVRLTRREKEVLVRLAQGLTTRQIAGLLGITYFTTRTHLRNLELKLDAHSKLEVVAKAYQLDLLAEPRAALDGA